MTILHVENTRQLPVGECIAVQSLDDGSALRSLQAIATRRHVTLCGKVYRWGQGYYYAEIVKESV